jgi:acyl carrier protein
LKRQRHAPHAARAKTGKRASASRDAIAGKVRAYIAATFLSDEEAATFSDDQDLLKLLNSLQLLRMVIELEKELAIHLENSELTAANLGSVERMAGFFARKIEAC